MKTLEHQRIIDLAVELNLPPSEYFALWEDLAHWQLEALRTVGLLPRHRLLDIGCGAMRLGLAAVEHLEGGNYFGIDAYPPYLVLAKRLAAEAGLTKPFALLQSDDFAFRRFGTTFDYANAQSVFTHLSAEQCERCMEHLSCVMNPGGLFLFTYLIGVPKTRGFLYGGVQPMQRLAVPDQEFFYDLGRRYGASFEPQDLPHPTGQRVGLYRYPS